MNSPMKLNSIAGWLWRLEGDDRLLALIDSGSLYGIPKRLYFPRPGTVVAETEGLRAEIEHLAGPIDIAPEHRLVEACRTIRLRKLGLLNAVLSSESWNR